MKKRKKLEKKDEIFAKAKMLALTKPTRSICGQDPGWS